MFKKGTDCNDCGASKCSSSKGKSVKVPKKSGRKSKTAPQEKETLEECKKQSFVADEEYDSDGEIVLRKSERRKYRKDRQ